MHVLTYLLEVQVKGTKNNAATYLAVPGWLEEVYWDIIGNPNRSIVPATRNHVKHGLCTKNPTDIDKETL